MYFFVHFFKKVGGEGLSRTRQQLMSEKKQLSFVLVEYNGSNDTFPKKRKKEKKEEKKEKIYEYIFFS